MRQLVAILVAAVTFTNCSGMKPTLALATTTSVVNSGLSDLVFPAYQRSAGERVVVVPVGSGRAAGRSRRRGPVEG